MECRAWVSSLRFGMAETMPTIGTPGRIAKRLTPFSETIGCAGFAARRAR
jgi:hypothetical protein